MTKVGIGGAQEVEGCAWCGRPIEAQPSTGRPRRYCRRSCRQRAYESRRRSAELGLGEAELVIARTDLDELRDELFVIRRAVDDARRAIRRGADVQEARELLDWIADAAGALP